LKNYQAFDEEEEAERCSFVQFLEAFSDEAYNRDNLVGHFSSSCWIVNKERNKALMIFHNMYKTWAWVGGHADGDDDMLYVAKKETMEETSLQNFKVVGNGPISVEILPVKSHVRKGKFVSGHLHLNITYLFEANENDSVKILEDENSNIGWLTFEELVSRSDEAYMIPVYEKIIEKIKNL
jgi:8-oxo-dGTP pyrophosphatase MutT (NUDIX family)